MFNPIEEQRKQQKFVDSIERLNGGAATRLEWDKLRGLFDDLTEDSPFVLHPLDATSKFARARIMEDGQRPNSLSEIGYVPQDKCRDFGRCHRPKHPMLYAGVGTELVLSEVGARPGDTVALLHMRPKQELMCIRLGAMNLWRVTSGHCLMHDDIKATIAKIHADPQNITAFLLDGFVADLLSRTGARDVYKLTSAYISALLDAKTDIAGVIYESVDHRGGACIALRHTVFDDLIEPIEVQVIKVTSYLGYGIFDFEELARTNKFDGPKIKW